MLVLGDAAWPALSASTLCDRNVSRARDLLVGKHLRIGEVAYPSTATRAGDAVYASHNPAVCASAANSR